MEFTKHVLTRYVERIENKFGTENVTFVAQNEDRIKERLLKLYESAEEIYEGKLREHGAAKFFFNKNGWLVITDIQKQKLITVYKCDLKLGEELNKLFWNKAISKINTFKELKEKEEFSNFEKTEQLNTEINSNKSKINEYKSIINQLENEIKILEEEKQVGQAKVASIDLDIKNTIEALVCKKVF